MKIIDGKIWRDGQKIGRLDGEHVRDSNDDKLGYFENNIIYNNDARKVAYIEENYLNFENSMPKISLEHINLEIEGTISLLAKCAIHVFFQD